MADWNSTNESRAQEKIQKWMNLHQLEQKEINDLKAQRQKDYAFCRGLIEGIKTIPTTATASNWSDYAAKVGYTNREHNKMIDQALTALAEHFGEKGKNNG